MRKLRIIGAGCLWFMLMGFIYGQSTTTITIPNTVSVSGVLRSGQTLGCSTEYGQGQCLKSMNYFNQGYFPGTYWQASFASQSGGTNDTTHFYNATTYTGTGINYPANFWVGSTYTVVSQSGTILGTGTITASTQQTSSAGVQFTLGTALSAAPVPGTNTSNSDYIIVRNRTPSTSLPASTLFANSAVSYSSDVSPSSTSAQSLQITGGNSWSTYIDQQFSSWAPDPTVTGPVVWVNVYGPHTLTYKAKCTSGTSVSMTATFNRGGYASSPDTLAACTATVGAGWTTFTHTFTGNETGSQNATGQLTISCPSGATCLIGDPDVQQGTAIGNTTPFKDSVVLALQKNNPGTLRLMYPGCWGSDIPDQIAPIGQRRASGFSNYDMSKVSVCIGYDDFLQLANQVGAAPWITVGDWNTPADMVTLMNWYQSSGWNAIFKAKGQFIYTEYGNELFNSNTTGATLATGTGKGYGAVMGPAFTAAKGASGYDPAVDKLMMNSWFSGSQASNPSSGSWAYNALHAAGCTTGGSSCPDYADIAFYTLNPLNNVTDTFTDDYASAANFNVTTCTYSTCTKPNIPAVVAYMATFGIKAAGYEGGQGILASSSSISQAQMNATADSVATGIIDSYNYLAAARDGGAYGPRNQFAFTDSPYVSTTGGTVQSSWVSQMYMAQGPGQPSWSDVAAPNGIIMGLVNRSIGAKTGLVASTQSGTPTFNYATGQSSTIPAISGLKYVDSFTYSDGAGNYTMIAFNFNETTANPILFAGAGAPTGTVQRYEFGGASNALSDTNMHSVVETHATPPVVAVPTATTMTNPTGDTLQPGGEYVYTWSTTPVSTTGTITTVGTTKQYGTVIQY